MTEKEKQILYRLEEQYLTPPDGGNPHDCLYLRNRNRKKSDRKEENTHVR